MLLSESLQCVTTALDSKQGQTPAAQRGKEGKAEEKRGHGGKGKEERKTGWKKEQKINKDRITAYKQKAEEMKILR